MNEPNPVGCTWIQRCKHKNTKGSEDFADLNISFCVDCGVIIVTVWDCHTQTIDRVKYISPMEAWEAAFTLEEKEND